MNKGVFSSTSDWYENCDIQNKILRIWYNKTSDEIEEPEICEYVYITQIIPFGNRIMIGVQSYDDESEDGRSSTIYYYWIDEVSLAYLPEDQD